MISCHRVVTFSHPLRTGKTSCIHLCCGYSSKSTGKDLEPVQKKTSLEEKDGTRESDLKLNESEDNELMEPERDNRIMVKKPFFHADNFIPTNWVTKLKTMKDNYLYPPATVVFKKDGVSRARYTICYRAETSRLYVGLAAGFSPVILAATMGFGFYGFFVDRTGNPGYDPYTFDQSSAALMIAVAGGIYYFVAYQYISRMKVIRMYYSKDKNDFIIVWFNPFFPYWIRKMTCKAGDAKIYEQRKFFPGASLINTMINGKKFFISADNFSFSAYFNVLYGYQKAKDIQKLLQTDGNEAAERFFKNKKHSDRSNIYNILK